MTTVPDRAACVAAAEGLAPGLVPVSPFTALQFHFGMLLGVDDLEVGQAYPRGKTRLHNAWLHGPGVVWGLGVRVNAQQELEVQPGLALDPAGHELHLDTRACLGFGAWFAEHRGDAGFVVTDVDADTVRFDAHVVLRFNACLTRPVPAMSEPCQSAERDTAYSRVFETVEILLRPGRAPALEPPPLPYHRARLLFGVADPELESGVPTAADQAVLDERAAVAALPADGQPARLLAALRRLAALDVIDLAPALGEDGSSTLLFPAADDAPVVLAEVRDITLDRRGTGWTLAAATVDATVRRALIATSTIQELLCGPGAGGGGGGGAPPPAPDAGGPRIDPESVTVNRDRDRVTMTADKALHEASVAPEAFSVMTFSEQTGWTVADVDRAQLRAAGLQLTVILKEKLNGKLLRVIARGTGEAPLLGADLVPLAGALAGPPGTVHDGHDFVATRPLRRS